MSMRMRREGSKMAKLHTRLPSIPQRHTLSTCTINHMKLFLDRGRRWPGLYVEQYGTGYVRTAFGLRKNFLAQTRAS